MKVDSNVKAKNKALSLLGFRAHSRQELIKKLEKNFDKVQAEEATKKMEELRLVDDVKFAENYALELFHRKKFAKKRIATELALRGISEKNINLALENKEIDEEVSISELMKKKFSDKLLNEKDKRRTIATLQRYGYEWHMIKKALSAIHEEEN